MKEKAIFDAHRSGLRIEIPIETAYDYVAAIRKYEDNVPMNENELTAVDQVRKEIALRVKEEDFKGEIDFKKKPYLLRVM